MEHVKQAYAWQEAIELSKQLVAVCEEFSDADTNVLVFHLRQAVIDIPAGIAADLQAGSKASMAPMVRLATTLELVKRIYPGIETGDAEEQFEKLWQRMSSAAFAESKPKPAPKKVEAKEEADTVAAAPAEASADEPEADASTPATETSVPITGGE